MARMSGDGLEKEVILHNLLPKQVKVERSKKVLLAEMLGVGLLQMTKEGRWKKRNFLLFKPGPWGIPTLPAIHLSLISATRFYQPRSRFGKGGLLNTEMLLRGASSLLAGTL